MGTSGGGAGGGSGGFGGGGGGGGGIVTLSRHALEEVDPSEAQAKAAFQGVFKRLSPEYLASTTGDAGVAAAYQALHTLHVLLVQNRSWKGVEERFGVAGDRGCLRALAEALSTEDGPVAVHPRLRALLLAALMDFFRRIVGGDPVLPQMGDAAAVLKRLDPSPFQSISARFFGAYLAEVLRLEDSLSTLGLSRLRAFALDKANQVVAAFEGRFSGRPWKEISQVGHVHFFRVMQEKPEWVIEQLRKER